MINIALEQDLLLPGYLGIVKKLKCVKIQSESKKSTSKTCVIITSFKAIVIEEMNEVRNNKY